ncbi:hypothetical protein PPERSA_01894 [Pseudocohnilembus persalinus]|uniref:Uncharacterized protein n=1 Tax=Pseudocohnilembus persalinus TaxID=266149 RepID=A0A0V0R3D7_PSEPJ|nr:hypothetical protein PPERSA_01894 [Pseudocohnilembus persalinus]|eukprot:KRX09007.1 hypothetical protein PPERSA_01894 [Pseudocohnilembus persalinus]
MQIQNNQPNQKRPSTNQLPSSQRKNLLQPIGKNFNQTQNNNNSNNNSYYNLQGFNINNNLDAEQNFGASIYKFGPYKERYRAYSTQNQMQRVLPQNVNYQNNSLNTSFQDKSEERNNRIWKTYNINNINNSVNNDSNSKYSRNSNKKNYESFVNNTKQKSVEISNHCDKHIHNPEPYQDIKIIQDMTHKLNELEADFLKRHSQFIRNLESDYEVVKTINNNYIKRKQNLLTRKCQILVNKFEQKLHQYNFIDLFNSENSLLQQNKGQFMKIRELETKLTNIQDLKQRVLKKEESGNILYKKVLESPQSSQISFNQLNQSYNNLKNQNQSQSLNQNLRRGPLITSNKLEVLTKQNNELKQEIRRLNDMISRLQIKQTEQFQKIIEKPKNINLNSQEEISKLFQVLNPNSQDFLPQKKIEFLRQVLKKQQEDLNLEEIKNQHNQIYESLQALNSYNQGKINKINIQNIVLMGIYQYLQDNNVDCYFSNENIGEKITFEQQMILTGQVQQCQYFQLELKQHTDIQQDFITSIGDENKYAQYTQNIAELISLILEIRPNDLQIIQLSEKNSSISFIVDFHVDLDQEMIQKFKMANVTITEHNLLQNCLLTQDFFQPNSLENCQQLVDQKFVGKINFKSLPEPQPQAFYPAIGFYAIPVNIKNKFDLIQLTNQQGSTKETINDWYSEDISEKSWIMLYNVIKNQQDYESEIVKQVMDKHISANCKITEQYILYTGNCYLYQNIQNKTKLAHEFSLNGKQYQMGFQCRINPKGVKIPAESNDLYIVGYPKDIRPYKIIIREKPEENNEIQ